MQNKPLRALSIQQRLKNEDCDDGPYYEIQPQYETSAMRVVGFERFARWNNPKSSRVFPDEFIPIAEAAYAISNIPRRMFEQAMGVLMGMGKAAIRWPSTFLSSTCCELPLRSKWKNAQRPAGSMPTGLCWKLTKV